MQYQSILQERGAVTFPTFAGERVYMHPFTKQDGLPASLSRWQKTVNQMLEGVDADGPIYLMVDQAKVDAGSPHRRPGLHIDGYWNPGVVSAHSPSSPGHVVEPVHIPRPPGHVPEGGSWAMAKFDAPEAIILATNIEASRAYVGQFKGPIGDGGDCAQVSLEGLNVVSLKADRAYAGNVSMLHESLPLGVDCLRTLVRLNVPGWTPH